MSRVKKITGCVSLLILLVSLSGCQRKVVDAWAVDGDDARQIREVVEAGAGGATASAGAKEPTGFATLTGVFQLSGPVTVAPGPMAVGNDAKFCSPNGTPLANTTLQIGADNGLANVALWLTKPRRIPDNPKWIHEEYVATRDATLTGTDAFDQKDCVFLSPMLAMRSTQKLEIRNSDSMLHNTKIEGDPGGGAASANSGISGGGKVMYEPVGYSNQPFRVSCSIHGWMQSYMLVRPNPFFAVTDRDGKFGIKHLPAGIEELEFRVNHEGKFLGDGVTLTKNGEDVSIKNGRFTLKDIKADEVIELKFVLDAKNYE